MAILVSPGVSVSVIDQSINVGAGPGTVPLVFIATQQDKLDPTSTGAVAVGTTQANAGKVWSITSQRDLVSTFGDPYFYSVGGSSLNGYPLNEYGLLASYSYLGLANLIRVVRADIDLAQLEPTPVEPTTPATAGTNWLDASTSAFGLFSRSNLTTTATWVPETISYYYESSFPATTDGIVGSNAVANVNGGLSYWRKITSTIWAQIGTYSYTSATGAVSGTGGPLNIVVASTANLVVGMTPIVSSGVGAFAPGTIITGITNATTFTVNLAPTTALTAVGLSVVKAGFNVTIPATGVWPDLTVATTNQYFWIKTTTPAQGADLQMKTMDAATQSFVNVSLPIFGGTLPQANAAADAYYANLPTESTGQMYAFINNINAAGAPGGTFGNNSLTVRQTQTVSFTAGTSAVYTLSTTEPTNGPVEGQKWFNALVGLYSDGKSTVDILLNDGLGHWTTMKTPGFSSANVAEIYLQSSDPRTNVPPASLIANDVWVDTDSDPYPVIRKWTGSAWVLVDNTDQTTPNGIIFADARSNPNYVAPTPDYVSAAGATSSGTTITVSTTAGLYVGMYLDVTSGIGVFPVNTQVSAILSATTFTSSFAPSTALSGGATVIRGEVIGGVGINNGGGIANNSVPVPDLDPDAPQAALYPKGFMLWNTRYSTNNVKQWESPYVYNGVTASEDNTNNNSTGRWVTYSGNNPGGVPYMGAAAQQISIVRAIQATVVSNEDIRAEDLYYNLIAAPGYVEVIDEMLALNDDRKGTAFVLGDTPFTLSASGTSLQNWATDNNGGYGNGVDGLVSASKYLGLWYPSGLSTNVDGTDVVVPPTHMALRTIAYNDQVAYPWFAPAGLQRGIVNNAAGVGYVNSAGQFIEVKLSEGQRDILYQNGINPIRQMPQGGIVVFGQKTRQPYSSATDRINVVRLENYLRYQLNNLAQPFLFEPNDSITRNAVLDAFNRALSELITLRGLYDFLVVCDTSNNTPARIDRNELWVDIAIQPVKAIEFIYIPIRIKNTGSSLT